MDKMDELRKLHNLRMVMCRPLEDNTLFSKCQIPIVDIAHMEIEQYPHKVVPKLTAAKLVRALSEKGLAFLVNHGLPNFKTRRVYGTMHMFCGLPEESRAEFASSSPDDHGYIKAETDAFTSADTSHVYVIDGNETPFPEEQCPLLHVTVDEFAEEFKKLATMLFNALDTALELPAKYFSSKHAHLLDAGNGSSLRVSLTPSTSRPDAGILRHGPIQDPGTFSLITQDFRCGMEIRRPASQIWDQVGYLPGAIIIRAGECLSKWTNQQIPALIYRSVTYEHDKRDRHSITFIVKPDDDVEIEPLDMKIAPVQEPPVLCRLQKKKRGVLGAYHNLQRRFREAYAS